MDRQQLRLATQLVREAQRIVVLSGAGISRPSGIPDFRSGSGVWMQHDPLEVASLHAFQHNPRRFYDWFNPLLGKIADARPNPAHIAVADLEHRRKLKAVITQNIDGLHQHAGSREVYEMHGNLRSMSCLDCGNRVPSAPLLRQIERGAIPRCSICGGLYKPDVVLFDEALPQGVFWLAQRALEHCDLLIVAGTSLEVAPVCDMPLTALKHRARLIVVNLDETYIDQRADALLHEDVALALPALAAAL
ncbi:NAD-dependent protein deacylase [Candidatus Gracilibacteria bacterium]|nr:NAD-dependent protein deacylase [Candidatus Gracilibacteria bacterium]